LAPIDVRRRKLPRKERKVIPALHRTPAALLQLNFATVNLLKLPRKGFASKFKNYETPFAFDFARRAESSITGLFKNNASGECAEMCYI
jgi:hypothetical protein